MTTPIVSYKDRCRAVVYKRDTYRYTGRGKTGFELHYQRGHCRHKAVSNGLCWQHQDKDAPGTVWDD